jgi:hypothetical protein
LNSGNQQDQFSIVFKEENSLGTIEFDDKNIFTTYDSNIKILQLYLDTGKESYQINGVSIYNNLGQEVMNIKLPDSNRIDVSQLSDGLYILKLNTKNTEKLKSLKFVKY